MSQPYLFYSDRCPNSIQIIETLKMLNKAGLYKFVKVESLQRNQIPSFLTKVPTLYVPETKDVFVGKDIFGFIAKPTNSRNEKPVSQGPIATGGASAAAPGEYTPWGFEGTNTLGEQYSSWNNPKQFTSDGGSLYTFLDGGVTQGPLQPETQNTSTGNKSSSNADIAARLEEMTKQREKEFGGISRK